MLSKKALLVGLASITIIGLSISLGLLHILNSQDRGGVIAGKGRESDITKELRSVNEESLLELERHKKIQSEIERRVANGGENAPLEGTSRRIGNALAELPPVEPTIVEHGPRETNAVALTFDLCESAGSTSGFDEQIVSILSRARAKATFFMGGKWAESHPDAARALGENELFEIANHSYSHKIFTNLSDDAARQEVVKAQKSIHEHAGITPRYFRFPAGKYAARDVRIAGEYGLVCVQWDVVTGDPDPKISAENIVSAVKQGTRGGSIIIMHANGRGWHTAEALPKVIDILRGEGYELVTISELLSNK